MSDDEPMLEAGAAAEAVGVSASGLRRLAPIYEQVYDKLPRKPRSDNRLWPTRAIERLQAARDLVNADLYRTVLEALEAIQRGIETEETAITPKSPRANPDATQRALEVLTAEVRQLRQEVAGLKALPAPAADREPVELQHGLMVRAAMRVERWLRRFR